MKKHCSICRGIRDVSSGGVCTGCGTPVQQVPASLEARLSIQCQRCTGMAFRRGGHGEIICEGCGDVYREQQSVPKSAPVQEKQLWQLRWIASGLRHSTFLYVLQGRIVDASRQFQGYIGRDVYAVAKELRGHVQPATFLPAEWPAEEGEP